MDRKSKANIKEESWINIDEGGQKEIKTDIKDLILCRAAQYSELPK